MKGKTKGKMIRLLGCLLTAVVLAGTVLPLSASAGGGKKAGYVLIKETQYKADGTLLGYDGYEYDNNGNRTKQASYTANGALNYYFVYEYDQNGNMTKQAEYNKNGSMVWYCEFEYDENGHQIRFRRCDPNGSVYFVVEFEHDEHGNTTKSITTYTGAESSFMDFEYDAGGNLVKETSYEADGTISGFSVYEYDAGGNLTKHAQYGADGIEWFSEVYEYDADGRQTKCTSYREGAVSSSEVYEYDADGNRIKRTFYNRDGSMGSYSIAEYVFLGDAGTTPEPEGRFASYEGFSFYRDADGNITCTDSAGTPVIDEFKCDGTYTYFFQADGTAMKDRLSYHPDGEHVIYFDGEGHEVFSDFANVRKSIAGDAVDDFCFFDVYGYLYVDVVTYDKTGTVLYYANPYGVMERGKWFRFSETVKCADGTPWAGAAGGYGYANADGTLMTNQWTYDWEGRYCYMQGNGVALYQ